MLLLLHPLVPGELLKTFALVLFRSLAPGEEFESLGFLHPLVPHQLPRDEEAEAISTPHQVSKTEVAPAPTTSTLHQAPINKETQPKVIATPDQVPISEDNKPYIN